METYRHHISGFYSVRADVEKTLDAPVVDARSLEAAAIAKGVIEASVGGYKEVSVA